MFRALYTRLLQGHRTAKYPGEPPVLPERFRGLPLIHYGACRADCDLCVKACPTGAITRAEDGLRLDMGKCLFCSDCEKACPQKAIEFSGEYRLCARKREDLVLSPKGFKIAEALKNETERLFGRSLKLRQVSAGGCNACEADANVLNTLVFDLGRFGIQFVASPRHADGLLITGPVTENMALALKKTYDAVPPPKIVIAVGACALSGGPYIGHPETRNGCEKLVPVDLFIPGCPPHPYTILDGLLKIMGRI